MDSTFPQSIMDELADRPEVVAFEHNGQSVTRAELADRIARCVTGLRAAGLGPGDGVAIATAVSPDGYAVQFAAYLVGCRVVGLRPGLTAGQVVHMTADVAGLVVDAGADTPELTNATGDTTVLRLDALLSHEPGGLTPQARPDDIAIVTFTSGSTGTPKGAAFSYAAMSRNWAFHTGRWSERTIRIAPHYSRFLLFGTLTSAVMQEHLAMCLLSGGTAVIPDGLPRFPEVLERHRISMALLTVPRLYQILDDLRDNPVDLSSARMLMVAGSPVATHRLSEGFDRIGPALVHAYGQTELGMISLLTASDVEQNPRALGSVGRIGDEYQVQIRDSDGNRLPDGSTGELWIKAPFGLREYWRDPDETAAVIVDGWIRSRDIGRIGEDGFVYLTGRAREIIIVNAIIHYAGPIERALAAHPDVDEAYVVGVDDERTGEAIHAFVVPSGARTPEPEALRAAVRTELGDAAVPAAITVIDSAPTTPTGKPDKLALLAGIA